MQGKSKLDYYLVVLVILGAIFTIYWTGYLAYSYRNFNTGFWDLGQETYSMYLHLHYASILSGLQFISFSNHLSLFKILLLPIFAIYQQPVTLLFLQELSLALAAIVAYFIGRDIVKNRKVGFALALCFLLSAGVRGIVFFDLHAEAYIPLFYLLSFYFYMKGRRNYFLASYILMLSTIETSILVAATFIPAMLIYELWYERKGTKEEISAHKNRLKFLAIAFLITLAFFIFYQYTTSTLLLMYSEGHYAALPPSVRDVNFISTQVESLKILGSVAYNPMLLPYVFIWGFLILFLGFGITSFRNIIITIILVFPWIYEVLILHNFGIGNLFFQYYAYSIGGATIAAALGFIIIAKGRKNSNPKNQKLFNRLSNLAIGLAIIISAILLLGLTNYPAGLIPTNWHTFPNYQSMQAALNSIPSNSSVMAQPSVSGHLYHVLYLELPPDYKVVGITATGFNTNINISTFYMRPEYIVLDRNFSDFSYYDNYSFNIYTYMDSNYTLYNSTNGLEIYKLRNAT